MTSQADPLRPGAMRRGAMVLLRLVSAVVGVAAVAATAALFLGKIDICGGLPGWWIGVVFITPLVFVGLCSWCASVVPSDVEKGAWVAVAALLMLLYLPAAAVAFVSGGGAISGC